VGRGHRAALPPGLLLPHAGDLQGPAPAAGKAGLLDPARDASGRLEHIGNLLADRERLSATARTAAARLRAQGEEDLARRCEEIAAPPDADGGPAVEPDDVRY
jgi:hypothetical protein